MTTRKALSRTIVALLLGLVLLSGCTLRRLQVGDPLDAESSAKLYSGQAKSEVLERLGPPDRVTMTWGEPIFEYLYREKLGRELKLSFWQASYDYKQNWQKADRLVVRFDRHGRVRDYGINLETNVSQ